MAVASGLPALLSVGVPPAYPAGGLTPSEIFIALVGFGRYCLSGYRVSLWMRPHGTRAAGVAAPGRYRARCSSGRGASA